MNPRDIKNGTLFLYASAVWKKDRGKLYRLYTNKWVKEILCLEWLQSYEYLGDIVQTERRVQERRVIMGRSASDD